MKEELKHARFRTVRLKSGLTQQDITYLLGLSHHEKLSRLEARMRMPTINDLLAYRIIFGCQLDDLLPREKKATEQEVLIRKRASKLRLMLSAQKKTPMLQKRLKALVDIAGRNIKK